MKVSIDDSMQSEGGIYVYAGTSIISVWDAESPEWEQELAKRIAELLEEYDE